MFKQLPENMSYPKIEHDVLDFWENENVFEKSLELRKDAPYYTFYEGPPTVNGKPGIHHMMARTIKDTICRYKTMQGFFVSRQAGWDTHGLPVEIQVEKQLGFKDKSDIEKYGIAEFNKACKDSVYNNIEMADGWRTLTRRMGYWVNMDNAYITCTNDYIESVWWALKTFFEKGLIFRGFKVVPQSPTIATPLSSHELSLGYKDVRDPNCYIKLKITQTKIAQAADAMILVWTTTPWTLFANVALACGEDIDYVLVANKRKAGDNIIEDKLILAKERLSVLDGEYEILSEFKGTELIGSRYEQIFDYCFIDKTEFTDALSVLAGDFVTTVNGSGIVHLAPAFGEDDYQMSRKYKIPFLQPVTPNGHLVDNMGEFSGRAIKNFTYDDRIEEGVDKDVVIALKYANKIYRSTNDYLHSYPHCWRTGNPIMYYARESWFIKSPEYKERLISLNKEINWQPYEIGSGRFGNWLEEVKDWSLSRDRYWGTPLPLWVNTDDKEDIMAVGSIEELTKGVYVFEDGREVPVSECGLEIDLHRPFVDNVVFKIGDKIYKRTHEVIDVWFDSGAMPFAQLHYPFENKEIFDKQFPADFIAEGIDQTRGWFYTLHNIATALFDKPAYKNIVVNELILDKNGVKMSKSKGNSIDPFELMEQYGADAIRWYLFVNNPPWNATKFNPDDIKTVVLSDFFRTLTQSYAFFALYANIDEFDGSEDFVSISSRPEIDKWIVSRLNTVLKEFNELMDSYELTKAHRLVQSFMIDEVSNWYIRRNRRRFWKGEMDNDKLAAYQTLKEVLVNVCYMVAPAAPFISEHLYQNLRTQSEPTSVHLCELPKGNFELIDTELESKMDIAQRIVFLARSLREKSKIRVRQPLERILVPVNSPAQRRDIQTVEDIILEEINLKRIEYVSGDSEEVVKRSLKPNFKTLGKKYGKQTNDVATLIRNSSSGLLKMLDKMGYAELDFNGDKITIELEEVEIHSEDIEGWLVAVDRGLTVALDTQLTPELLSEGLAREFVSKIQNARKEAGFEVTDRISIQVKGEENDVLSLKLSLDYIKSETLAESVDFIENDNENLVEIELIDSKVGILVSKI